MTVSRSRTVALLLAGVIAVAGCSSGSPASSGQSSPPSASPSSSLSPRVSGTATTTGSPAPSATAAGSTASPSGASAGSSPSSPSPSAVPFVAPPVPAVKGYTYAAAPKPIVAALQAFAASYRGVFSVPTVRSVTRSGTSIGSVALMRLNPSYVGTAAIENRLVTGLVQGMSGKGYTSRTRVVAGTSVVLASKPGSSVLAWYRSGVIVLLVSTQAQAVPLAFATAYLRTTKP